MAHMYQDISHRNAPYKNVLVGGMGDTLAAAASPLDEFTFINAVGLRQVKPEIAQALVTKLTYMNAIFITDERYKLQQYPQESINILQQQPGSDGAKMLISYSGIGVIKKWLDEKKIPLVTPSVVGPISTVDQELGAILASDTQRISDVANSGLRDAAFVFAMPGELDSALKAVTPSQMAVSKASFEISKNTVYILLGLGVATAGYYGYQKYAKKHGRY